MQDFLLAFRRIDGQAENAFNLADLDSVLGALVEQPDDHLVHAVDGIANAINLTFSIVSIHKKSSSRRREEVIDPSAVERPFSATGRTRCPSLDVVAVIKRVREGAALHEWGEVMERRAACQEFRAPLRRRAPEHRRPLHRRWPRRWRSRRPRHRSGPAALRSARARRSRNRPPAAWAPCGAPRRGATAAPDRAPSARR